MAEPKTDTEQNSRVAGPVSKSDAGTPKDLGIAIESDLGALWAYINGAARSCRRPELLEHQRRAFAMAFHTQIPTHINNAWEALNRLAKLLGEAKAHELCQQERIRAREIIYDIGEWARDVRMSTIFNTYKSEEREFDPFFTIRVTPRAVELLQELSRLGRRIRMGLIEIGASSPAAVTQDRTKTRLMNVALALAMLKKQPDLSNAALAQAIGVNGATVGRWKEVKLFRQTQISSVQRSRGQFTKPRGSGHSYVEGVQDEEPERPQFDSLPDDMCGAEDDDEEQE